MSDTRTEPTIAEQIEHAEYCVEMAKGDASLEQMERATLNTLRSVEALQRDAARLDYLIDWLGHNEDVSEMPVRDWLDREDARTAIDTAMGAS
jgi:hypothetical protein